MKKQILAGIISLTMALGLMPTTALANDVENSQIAEQLSQTATNLDEGYISDVTLSFPSDGYRRPLDVVFVLDGSTSSDKTNLTDAAAAMLEELASIEKLDAKVGVVLFGGYQPILSTTELTVLNDVSIGQLKNDITTTQYNDLKDEKGNKLRSGSNLQAGVEAARDLLNGDDTVADSDKYLIILSDGGARMWYGSDTGESSSKQYGGYYCVVDDFNDHCEDYGLKAFDEVFAEDPEVVNQYSATYSQWLDGEATDTAQYVASDSNFYTSLEAGVYFAAHSIVDAKEEDGTNVIWVDYPYYEGTNYYTYTESCKSWLAEHGYITRYDSSDVSDASTMFDEIRNNWIYFVDEGSTVDNTIGYGTDNAGGDYDFQMVNLDAMKLTFGGDVLTAQKIEDNHYGFGTQDSNSGKYPFELTYYPNGQDGSGEESFELSINTAVKLDQKVTLTYQVKLTNPRSEVGTYGTYDEDGSENLESLRVSAAAVLHPVDSQGQAGTDLNFPLPTVGYSVIGVTPASLTIYMGGSSGYTSIVGEDGTTIEDTVSLPEPGFYLELPDSVNTELRQILGKDENDVIDLSQYVTLTAKTSDGTTLTWKLERYGAGSGDTTSAGLIDQENRFIYKIVPVGDGGAKVRVKVSSTEGTVGSDEFEADNALYTTYQMEIYGEGVDAASLTAQIQVPGAEGEPDQYSRTFRLVGGDPATLTVRYVVGRQEDVVTGALNSITEAHDAGKAYVVLQDLNGNAAEDFVINRTVTGTDGTELTVQVDPSSVSLLFDDIVSASDTGDQQTHFEKTLVDKAVAATGQSFQNLQYQAKYLDLVEADNGNAWLTTSDKVTVYWPYPQGTDANTKFYLQHFVGVDRDDTLQGITDELETTTPATVEVHTDANGIYFETNSFSPYVLMWEGDTVTEEEEEDGDEQPAATPQPTTAPTAEPAAATATTTATPTSTAIPQTGDNSQPLLWVVLACCSGAALAGLTVYRRKRSGR